MNAKDALDTLRRSKEALRARGGGRPDSNIGILVEFDPAAPLIRASGSAAVYPPQAIRARRARASISRSAIQCRV